MEPATGSGSNSSGSVSLHTFRAPSYGLDLLFGCGFRACIMAAMHLEASRGGTMQIIPRTPLADGAAIQQGATPFQISLNQHRYRRFPTKSSMASKAPQSHIREISQDAEDGQSTNLEILGLVPNEIESLRTATSFKGVWGGLTGRLAHVQTWCCFLQRGKNHYVSLKNCQRHSDILQVYLRYMIL